MQTEAIMWQWIYIAFLLAILAGPIVAIGVALRRIRGGFVGRLKGFVLYGLVALSPTVLYVALFFALVGIEELTGAPLIAEEIGRSFLLVVAFGLAIWLLALVAFAVAVGRVNIPEKSHTKTTSAGGADTAP